LRLFFAVAGLAALMLVSCEKPFEAGVSVDKELQKFAGADTTMLAGIDMEKFKSTGFYARHKDLLNIPLLAGMSEQTDFDPRRDLTQGLLTWNGKAVLAAARGRFAKDKIERSLGAAPAQYKGQTIFTFRGDALSFPSSDVAIGGSVRSVESALDAAKDGPGKVPAEFSPALSWLPKTNQLWLVSRGGLPFADAPLRPDYASILSNFAGYVRTTAAGVTAGDGLHLTARVDCVSEVGSKRVNDALRGGIGLARLSTKDSELDMLRSYDAVHVKQDGATVYVDADLSPDLADKLLNRIDGFNIRERLARPR